MNEVECELLLAQIAEETYLRRTARHETAHGLLAELFGMGCASVQVNDDGSGVAHFRRAPATAAEGVAVALIGHASEISSCGGIEQVSKRDRQMARSALKALGLGRDEAKRAVREIEIELALVFIDPTLRAILRRVGRKLARTRFLDRRAFLKACDDAAVDALRDERLRSRVRSFCRRVVREAVDVYRTEVEA